MLTSVFFMDTTQSVIVVAPHDGNYKSIQSAIDEAEYGDVVEVRAGTYRENVKLNKKITLIGENTGGRTPIVDGMGGSAITFCADGATLDGFIIMNSSREGINVTSNHNIIRNNIISNNSIGIRINSDHNVAINNLCENNSRTGIELVKSIRNSLINNCLINNNIGMFVIHSSENMFINNTLDNNRNNGFEIFQSTNNLLDNNTIVDNQLIGISLTESKENTLRNNVMIHNRYNFKAEGENYIDISNLVDEKPICYLINSHNVVIGPPFEAGSIHCINCTNITVIGQTITNNGDGIYFYNVTNSVIKDNYVGNNLKGIYISKSSDNVILVDNASNNGYPIYVVGSFNNTIYIDITNVGGNKYVSYFDSYSLANNSIEYSGSGDFKGCPNWFYVYITVEDPGLWIYWDGKNTSEMDFCKIPLDSQGDHKISLYNDDNLTHEITFYIYGKSEININSTTCDFSMRGRCKLSNS